MEVLMATNSTMALVVILVKLIMNVFMMVADAISVKYPQIESMTAGVDISEKLIQNASTAAPAALWDISMANIYTMLPATLLPVLMACGAGKSFSFSTFLCEVTTETGENSPA